MPPSNSYMWIQPAGTQGVPVVVVVDYDASRGGQGRALAGTATYGEPTLRTWLDQMQPCVIPKSALGVQLSHAVGKHQLVKAAVTISHYVTSVFMQQSRRHLPAMVRTVAGHRYPLCSYFLIGLTYLPNAALSQQSVNMDYAQQTVSPDTGSAHPAIAAGHRRYRSGAATTEAN